MIGLMRSENLKIFTTKTWWAMLIGLFGAVVIALLANGGIAIADLDSTSPSFTESGHAAAIYTSGQYFGVLFAAILGTLLMTNEYRHQTLTGTFLATPERIKVIFAKLFVVVWWGLVYAAFTTAISVPVGVGVFNIADTDTSLGDTTVLKAIGLNFLAFALWAIIGFGVGSMFRSQAGALVLLIVGYLVTTQVLMIILAIIAAATDNFDVIQPYYYLPYGATSVMTSAGEAASLTSDVEQLDPPEWWVGMIMLMFYGIATAAIGTSLTLKRDVA